MMSNWLTVGTDGLSSLAYKSVEILSTYTSNFIWFCERLAELP